MTKANPGQRVVLQLDSRIALEAIILNRLERIPTARRQEWLRSLLVQGFRLECQALRGVSEEQDNRPAMAFTPSLVGGSPDRKVSTTKPEPVQAEPPEAKATTKPFAALGKVIG